MADVRHVPPGLLRVRTEDAAVAIAAYGRAVCRATDVRLLVRDRCGDLVGPYPGAHRRTLPVDLPAALVDRVRRELARPVDDVVALVDAGTLIGVAVVAGRQAPEETLAELAGTGAGALAVHLELRDLREHAAGLEAMLETARTLAGEEQARTVIRSIVARARRVVGSEVASLALVAGGETRLQAAVGNTNPFFDRAVVRSGASLVGTVAATGEPLVTSDFLGDDRFPHLAEVDRAVEAEGLHSVLGVPMRVGRDVVGVLCVSNRSRDRRFASRDVEIVSGLADHAALAYRNAERHEEARAAAVRLDRLNRRTTRRNEALRRAAAVDDRLTDLVLEDAAVEALVEGIADVTGRPVAVFDAAERPVARAGTAGPDAATVVPIVAAGELLGTLALGGPAGDRVLSEAQQAARAAALVLLRARAVDEAEDRLRGELADELFDSDVPAQRASRRGRRLGVDLERPLRLAVSDPLAGEAVVRPLARAEAGLLAAVHRRRHVLLVLDEGIDEAALAGLLRRATPAQRPVRLALVGPAESVEGLRRLHADALRCLEVAEALTLPDHVVTPDRLGARFLLAGADASPHVADFVERVLAPLAPRAREAMDLVATLESLFAHGGNVLATARALHVHPNTLYHRLARIHERTGLDPRDVEGAFELQLALRLRH